MEMNSIFYQGLERKKRGNSKSILISTAILDRFETF